MRRSRRQLPFADRVEVWRPISAELLAAATLVPHDLARQFLVEWYVAAEALTARRWVLVFDEFVVGLPNPLLLEAAHCVRLMRGAEQAGEFDDEEQQWYEEHPDDDEVWDPPAIPARVLAAMSGGWEGDRLADGSLVAGLVLRALRPTDGQHFDIVRLGLTLERLLADLADAVRVGDAAVVDARLPTEFVGSWRWAA
jgi:hypothetical protein